ncbi:MAG: hypothetical protein QQN41_00055 [Nitrosopumilus sp.]
MANNLDIGLNEFKRMKSLDRDVLMYNNLIHIRSRIGDYKFHKKVFYVWLTALSIFVGLKRFVGF